jgi:hypothetical protein
VTRVTVADLEESKAHEATGLLIAQRAAYGELLEELRVEESAEHAARPERLQRLATTAERLLQPLAAQTAALSALARRLRRPGCTGPRADLTRGLLAEVGVLAADAGARFDRLIVTLRADQRRTLAEANTLERDTPPAYQSLATGSALLVDRTG